MLRTVLRNPWVQAGFALTGLVGLCVLVYLLIPVLVPLLLAFYLATRAAGWTERWHAPSSTQEQMRARYGIPEEYVVLGTFPRPVW